MRLAVLLALVLTPAAALGQKPDDLDVLPGPAKAMVYDHEMGLARGFFAARREAVAALKTPRDVAERQSALKARFVEALGGFPEKTPLNARVVGREKREGYRYEKVVFESRPNHHVTATLYLPAGEPPHPAVLIPCGHDANAKAAEPYQRACVSLARQGIAALCFDPIGQGERRQLLDDAGKPAISAGTTEHTLIGVGALLVGRSTASYRVWDGVRAIDYLASRPEVDARRVGVTGCSGGGTETSYLMALDERVTAAAPSCYVTSLERLFLTRGPQDAEQNITGQVAFGMDHADYLGMRAPRPTLILAATRDFFDQEGTWATFREAKQLYGLLGHPERVDIAETNTPHGYPKPQREAMLRWMRRWLLDRDDAPDEGEMSVAPDAELQCTRTGEVLADYHGKSAFDLNADRADELARKRSEGQARRDLLPAVRRLIALQTLATPPRIEEQGERSRGDATVYKRIVTTEPGILVPVLKIVPKTVKDGSPLVVVVGHDRATVLKAGGLVDEVLGKGQRVVLADLRGLGETSPAPRDAKSPSTLGVDVKEAFLSFHLNKPLMGQRVFDVLQVLDALGEAETKDGVHLYGVGVGGPVALHASALDPRVGSLTLRGSILSWDDVVRTPLGRDQLSNVVPGALAVYDLPDLAVSFAPRPLQILSPVDPAGRPASQAASDRATETVRNAYHARDKDSALNIRAAP